MFNRTDPDRDPAHGDSVVLQAWTGRFLTAVGGGGGVVSSELEWIDAWSTFTIERVGGAGTIRSDDQIALRAANGNYVVAEDGGGGIVNANRTYRTHWETFQIKMFRPQLIRLRSSAGRFVSAEGGGGGPVTANREEVGLWETFSLINHSRSDRSIQNGDIVALKAWEGRFVNVANLGRLEAGVRRATPAALFRVGSSDGGAIEHGRRMSLQSLATSRYVAADAGVLIANSITATDEALFTIELAERAGIDFGWIPDGSEFPLRPLASPPFSVTGDRKLLVIHHFDESRPPVSASNDQIALSIFGPRPSPADWIRTMSGGTFTISRAGLFGPIRRSIAGLDPNDVSLHISELLTKAEQQGVPLASFARGGLIDYNDVTLVRLEAGSGGTTRSVDSISGAGVRYLGRTPSAGVSTTPTGNIAESSQGVISHELSHAILDVVDKYPLRRQLRGDVVANRTWIGDWEKYIIERIAGTGPVRSGDRVMIRAHNGQHLAVGASPPELVPDRINMEGEAAGAKRVFTITKVSGTGEISSGDRVTFRSHAGRYMTAEHGGDSVVTANRTEPRTWEQFEATKLAGGGILNSGDTISLKSSGGFYLAAEENARDRSRNTPEDPGIDARDIQRGYLWAVGSGPGGNFDNSSANERMVLLSLYDRIRVDWVRPRYLTPDNRGCYLIRPFVDSREGLILFDPQNPRDWYTLENRQFRENVDEVPSSGIVISWINQDEGYWRWWFNRANDPEPHLATALYPAVISAAAPTVPPNMMALPTVYNIDRFTKRNDPNAAFTNQEVVLPLGNGDASRFHLSFHPMGGENVAVCIR
jgi:hypothetical protein